MADVKVQTLAGKTIYQSSITDTQDIELADLVAGHAYYIVRYPIRSLTAAAALQQER